MPFGPGDFLLLCSDGAAEVDNPAGEPFGTTRLERIFGATGGAEVADVLITALEDCRAGAPLEDDLTILTLKRNPLS